MCFTLPALSPACVLFFSGLEVRLDDAVIGKTPIFSARFSAGLHVLHIRDSETDIHLAAG